MKKIASFLMAFCICISLAACSSMEDAESLLGTAPSSAAEGEAATAPATPALDPKTPEAPSLSVPYQYGNMQKNIPSGDFMRYGNDILFSVQGTYRLLLYSMDMTTGKVSLFCKDATCQHNSTKCTSAGAVTNLEQYGGTVYAMNGWTSGKVMVLKNGSFEPVTDSPVSRFWHGNGNLYAVTEDGSLVVFENGSSKPRILLDEYIDYWNVIFGQYLYGCTGSGISRVDLSAEHPQKERIISDPDGIIDGTNIYYTDPKTFYLYRCNMDGSEPQLLLDQPVLPASMNFDEDYFYFRLYTEFDPNSETAVLSGPDSHDIYRLEKADPTQIVKIAELPVPAYQIFTVPGYGKIFVTTIHSAQEEEGKNQIYTVATDGSSIEPLEIPEY